MSVATRLNRRITQLAVGRHLPHRTARVRLTLLYGGLFLLSGAALVAITYVLFQQATQYTKPHLPNIPRTPALQQVQLPQLPRFLPQLARDQYQLRRTSISWPRPPCRRAEGLCIRWNIPCRR